MFCDRVVRDASPRKTPRGGQRPRTSPPPAPARAAAEPGSSEQSLMSRSFDRRSLLQELAAKGVRLTAQRRALVEVIQEAEQHLDAAELWERTRRRGVDLDRATVYRALELLKKHRLIDELDLMHLQGEKHFYEVKTRRDHIHLACFQCGRIVEFASPLFEK